MENAISLVNKLVVNNTCTVRNVILVYGLQIDKFNLIILGYTSVTEFPQINIHITIVYKKSI